MITHHLNDKLLMAYSAGSLPEAFNLVVATHISICDECRARLASFDAIGGALLDQDDSAEMGAQSLSTVMARIKTAGPVAKEKPQTRDAVLPAPLVAAIGGGLDKVQWRAVGGGVRQAILKTSDKATARLLHIPGGVAVPDHGHQGLELTLVLQGAFRDEDGRFGRGDIEIASEEVEHTPVAEPGMDCICLAATDAPLKFRSILPRLAQPFLRI
ncbi:ChrR family anti-sigma-E factor [Roseibaca sp. Y0-43]|uniref:ChrR family anti-sigma-E factor n=1 Tax=Roseibaca sp. Y0-43 TaxID=2816854 RepID=UPI001D0CC315|nr:ChrR family anti-sigma-E factor [Roseibaca sp. Y0-43]MCC1482387.1 cupin domain-containing protein [Roseibaca sp. Y0-43]